jgi:hypothetical protein
LGFGDAVVAIAITLLAIDLPGGVSRGTSRLRGHIGTLIPRFTSQTLAGQEVAKPMIMPICMSSQKAARSGIS